MHTYTHGEVTHFETSKHGLDCCSLCASFIYNSPSRKVFSHSCPAVSVNLNAPGESHQFLRGHGILLQVGIQMIDVPLFVCRNDGCFKLLPLSTNQSVHALQDSCCWGKGHVRSLHATRFDIFFGSRPYTTAILTRRAFENPTTHT